VESAAPHRIDEDAHRHSFARAPADELGEALAGLSRLPDVHVDVDAVARAADRVLDRLEHLAVVPRGEPVARGHRRGGRLQQGESD